MQFEEQLGLRDPVARTDEPAHAGGGRHRVLLARPAGPEDPGGFSHSPGVQPGDVSRRRGLDPLDVGSGRQRCVGVAALGRDHRAPLVHGGTGGENRSGIGVYLCQLAHGLGQSERELDHVRGSATGEHLDRLGHLDSVAGVVAQRCVHVGEQGSGPHAVGLTQADHRLGQLAGASHLGHERAGTELDVEDQRGGTFRDLLRHDRTGDEGDRLDGARDIAQRVHASVGRSELCPGRTDHRTHVAELSGVVATGHLGAPAGDRLQLVDRASGVTQAPARHLGNRCTTGCDQWAERQRDLVADPTGGVLVDRRAAQRTEIGALAGIDHGRCPGGELARRHPAQQDRHQQGGGLFVADRSRGEVLDEPPDLLGAQLAAVTFGSDDIEDRDVGHGSPGRVSPHGPRRRPVRTRGVAAARG